jgi:hypothetical protein
VVPLGQYYAAYARRAEWRDTWRLDMSKGEKLQVPRDPPPTKGEETRCREIVVIGSCFAF